MALGTWEPVVEPVPGTVYVHEENRRTEELLNQVSVKKTKDGKTILVPQPSNDPNDPLVSPPVTTFMTSV